MEVETLLNLKISIGSMKQYLVLKNGTHLPILQWRIRLNYLIKMETLTLMKKTYTISLFRSWNTKKESFQWWEYKSLLN